MPLSLNNIQTKSPNKAKKRVGRGDRSGMGTYSGRGQKGQRSRAGASGLQTLGLKVQWKKVPKLRGFNSSKSDNQIVKTDDINANFKEGEKITAAALKEKKIIKKENLPIKILQGKDQLQVKNLQVDKNIKASKEVASQLK
jgi:Ribosomal protein L15